MGRFTAVVFAFALVSGCGSTHSSPKSDTGGSDGRGGDMGGLNGLGGASATAGLGGGSGDGGTSAGGAVGASGGVGGGTAGDAGAGGVAIPFYPLDMNDVTILAPLPQTLEAPVLLRGDDLADDGTVLVPPALFERLAKDELRSPGLYSNLHLVAVRFDLCDRRPPGGCGETEDAQLRLVFQPLSTGPLARDVGLHAFYTIPNDQIPAAVGALRELAQIAPKQTGALRVSPALTGAAREPYATGLRAFVKRYGGEARLVQLTANLQPEIFESVRWSLRGVVKVGDVFVDIPIEGTREVSQSVVLSGGGYDVTPPVDQPAGLLGAITATVFNAADLETKRNYLAALVATDNPLSHTAQTVPCVACHVSTVVMSQRTGTVSDPLALPGRYTSRFDLSISAGMSAQTPQTIRALGYLAQQPMISQRVVNETAQTLTEIEARFPPP